MVGLHRLHLDCDTYRMTHEIAGWQEVPATQALIRVSLTEPIAIVLRSGEPDHVVTWPDLPVGMISPTTRVVAAPDGAWILYTPMERDDDRSSQDATTALHISTAGKLTRFIDLVQVGCLGATRHGLWLAVGRGDANIETEADWLTDRTLLVLDANGGTHTMTVDRVPAAVREDASTPHLVVYAGAPDALHDGYGGASYTYRYVQVDLPAGILPPILRIDEHRPISVEEDDLHGRSRDEEPARYPLSPEDPRLSWARVDLPADQRQAAIDAVTAEFMNLDTYWTAPTGATTPLSDDLDDSRIDVIGEWPTTLVEVSFTYPHYPEGRLRRTYRVFDDAGRVKPPQFAAIHLMEDLDTRDLPPADHAHNTILDI